MKTRNAVVNTSAEVRRNPDMADVMKVIPGIGGRDGGAAILASEAMGQRQLLQSLVLPAEIRDYSIPQPDGASERGNSRKLLESWGFEFGKRVGGDTLFQYAKLPAGWAKKGSNHDMWTSIVDERGRERCSIFYKAAHYDRNAFLNVSSRYSVEVEVQGQKRRGVVKEADVVLFEGPWLEDTPEQKGAVAERRPVQGPLSYDRARQDAVTWLREKFSLDLAEQWGRP
jgi:hypothetical protein